MCTLEVVGASQNRKNSNGTIQLVNDRKIILLKSSKFEKSRCQKINIL